MSALLGTVMRCGAGLAVFLALSIQADPEPVLKPGIVGLKMEDVRGHSHLWRELDELEAWERGNRISVAEYRGKVIEKTAQYLGFAGEAAERFGAASRREVASVREAFARTRRLDVDPIAAQARLSTELSAAVDRVGELLGPAPRHQLFKPDLMKWLLRMAFGPKEAKEAQEAKEGKEAQGPPESPPS